MYKKIRLYLVSFSVLVVNIFIADASCAQFTPLGHINLSDNSSVATGVSNDGKVVVGYSTAVPGGAEAFRWHIDTGIAGLGVPISINGAESAALGVSDDGNVVVGWGSIYVNYNISRIAVRWTEENGYDLVPMRSSYSMLRDASYDGTFVSGVLGSENNYGGSLWENNLYKSGFSIYEHKLDARAISADLPVMGLFDLYYVFGESAARSFLWDGSDNRLVLIPDLPGGNLHSEYIIVEDISANGKVIVGMSEGSNGYQAIRWSQEMGTQGLNSLPGWSESHARGISANEKIIVGNAYNALTGSQAFIYTDNFGMKDLQLELQIQLNVDLTGWKLTKATAISANGMVVVGEGVNPQGKTEAWRAVITGLFSGDSDFDGVDDIFDNCIIISNTRQIDVDHDGVGNYCDADFNNDNFNNAEDYLLLRSKIGSTARVLDLNNDGVVTAIDYAIYRGL